MTKYKTKDKTRQRRVNPEMARAGATNMASYMRGVTTLDHYERISSRDLGLKELRIFGTEVVLTFLGGFSVGMM